MKAYSRYEARLADTKRNATRRFKADSYLH